MLVQSTPLRTSSENDLAGCLVLSLRQLLRRLQDILVDVERGAHASDANASDAVMQGGATFYAPIDHSTGPLPVRLDPSGVGKNPFVFQPEFPVGSSETPFAELPRCSDTPTANASANEERGDAADNTRCRSGDIFS